MKTKYRMSYIHKVHTQNSKESQLHGDTDIKTKIYNRHMLSVKTPHSKTHHGSCSYLNFQAAVSIQQYLQPL